MYTQKAFLDIKGYGGMCMGRDMDRQMEIAAAAVAALMVVVAAVEEMV